MKLWWENTFCSLKLACIQYGHAWVEILPRDEKLDECRRLWEGRGDRNLQKPVWSYHFRNTFEKCTIFISIIGMSNRVHRPRAPLHAPTSHVTDSTIHSKSTQVIPPPAHTYLQFDYIYFNPFSLSYKESPVWERTAIIWFTCCFRCCPVSFFLSLLGNLTIVNITASSKQLKGAVRLNCEVQGSPSPHVWWSRNVSHGSQIYFENENKTLVIDYARVGDIGTYYCHARNNFTYAKSSFELNLIRKFWRYTCSV
jgi:hypothetical protein